MESELKIHYSLFRCGGNEFCSVENGRELLQEGRVFMNNTSGVGWGVLLKIFNSSPNHLLTIW